jgi:branched-chain amino acid aminotransferase
MERRCVVGLRVYIDGKLYDKEEAKISVFDHGLLYGDGVFEGMRCYKGLLFKLGDHLNRLYESANTIMLRIPLTRSEMQDAVVETVRANREHAADAYVRLVVTRGVGDLGLDPRKCNRPTVFIIVDVINLYAPELYKRGLDIVTVPTRRSVTEILNPQVKSLNYLNNIMGKIEATNIGAEEALMVNGQGYVTECTADNIFIVKNGTALTPPTYVGTLRGITRDAVIGIAARLGIPLCEQPFTRHDVFNADECFVTGTAAEIIPIVRLDGRTIGAGVPGNITNNLIREFRKLTAFDGVRAF